MRRDAVQRPVFYTNATTDEDVLLVFSNPEEWLSRRQIAERVWRKVTPAFRDRLERLVGQGKLIKTVEQLPNHREMFWYKRGAQ